MTTIAPIGSLANQKKSLKEQIETLTTDLVYPSESDEKIEFFEMEFSTTQKLSLAEFRMFNGIKPETVITEMSFDDFFKPLIKVEDWFSKEEKKWVADSLKLKNLLFEKAKDFQIFKVGATEIEVYVLGKAEEGRWVGLKTKVIET